MPDLQKNNQYPKLLKRIHDLTIEIHEKENIIHKLRSEKIDLLNKIENNNQTIFKINNNNNKLNDNITSKSAEIRNLKNKIREIERENKSLKSKLESYEKKFANFQKSL